MYQQDLQNGLLHASKMAEALVRLQQHGAAAECVLPGSVDVSRQSADDGRRLSYDQQSSSSACVDFSHAGRGAGQMAAHSSGVACGAGGGGGGALDVNQSLFVVITRSEYDAMRHELSALKQSLGELRTSVDQEMRQLRTESRMLRQHLSTCTCGGQ